MPRTFDEIASKSRIGRKEIGRTYRFMTRELHLKLMPTRPQDYIQRFCSELKLKGEIQTRANEILKEATERELTSGRGPTGVAAAAIYIASVQCGERRTQREVAEVGGRDRGHDPQPLQGAHREAQPARHALSGPSGVYHPRGSVPARDVRLVEELAAAALRAADTADIVYADVRVVAPKRYLQLAVRDGAASALTSALASGIGVRVRTRRAWGFAGTSDLSLANARTTARLAVRLARAASRSAKAPLRVTDEVGPTDGRYITPLREDPFEVSREEVIALLIDAEKRLHVGLRGEERDRVVPGVGRDEMVPLLGRGVVPLADRARGRRGQRDRRARSIVQTRSAPNSFGGDLPAGRF